MVLRGHVKNGVIVLDQPVQLPEGAAVEINLIAPPTSGQTGDKTPILYERLQPIIGAAQGLPPDASTNVDHYLYGHPKT